MKVYDNPQSQKQLAEGQSKEDDYYYPGDMWYGRGSNDIALQVKEATYSTIDDLHENDEIFERWVTSRKLVLARAARIPGIDTKTYNHLSVGFKYIVARAHSEGREKVLRSMMEEFDFDLELLVSKGDVAMAGMTGIGAITTQNINQKQEIRMPQQPAPPTLLGGLANVFKGK